MVDLGHFIQTFNELGAINGIRHLHIGPFDTILLTEFRNEITEAGHLKPAQLSIGIKNGVELFRHHFPSHYLFARILLSDKHFFL